MIADKMPQQFVAMHAETRAASENNDCAVKAVALLTGAPYSQVLELMAKHGRQARKGTFRGTTQAVIEELGFTVRKWTFKERLDLIASYSPKAPQWYQSLTTKQVKAYNKKWRALPCQSMLLFSTQHVSAYKDGEVIDWAHNRAKRINDIWEVIRVG